ncbi:divergent polysaccharide deacetylase family protein [Pseudomonas sp. SZMC_28357]|uniref:divergent polysaccharide deacetylase family protein n=1 Tax=Pseudomonas sp. SZMC_28357 TaxID=3074380 RepID=UPI002871D487|nr:divergent polysaccharide deacetylase family protein [Pseudomonas sp. SZMC_28357]MDR9753220.1 divergent polysaccharide deacetylase family protein [Pseudomonas sp. SZMC_28357]
MRRWLLIGLLGCLAGAAHAAPAPPESKPHKAYLSLIIDDLGQNLPRDRRVLSLPGPVTTAIMPDTPHAAEFAREAHRAGKIVILHMPMDPATGPFAWHPELPIEELQKRLDAAFNAVPFTSGINNHMGSRMTAQPVAMAWLMGELQRRHKFFVDSRTSAQTVGAAEAQKIGLASVSRDVFLDDERTEAAIFTQLQTAISLARKQGSAVMIGHPYPQTLAVLERELPKLKAQGIDWIDIRLMISVRSNLATAAHGVKGVYRPARPATQ